MHASTSTVISVAEAIRLVLDAAPRPEPQTVALDRAAGRILAETIVAERDQPPFDRVMMDGIAIRHGGGRERRFRIAGTVYAGEAPSLCIDDDTTCLEVMTGCVLPTGADTVIPVEQIRVEDTTALLSEDAQVSEGQFIHRRGSDHPAATQLLAPGQLIGAAELAVLATAGAAETAVTRALDVAVIATGDELVAPGQPIEAHQIRLSNGPALVAAAREHGAASATLVHCPDSQQQLREVLDEQLGKTDVVVLSGGVSKGKADYVPAVLAELGVAEIFHRVAQKPGKPLWFGRLDNKVVFGLPGNPVSALLTFHRYVAPFLARAHGVTLTRQPELVLAEPVDRLARLARFVPVRIDNVAGTLNARPVRFNTSGDFTALAGTNGFIEVAPGSAALERDMTAPYFSWQRQFRS